ncbi:hypothetical protein FH969_13620 [Miniimonas arenae]|uniref:Antitoxin FitA-like ribbon-helix-helix domain-containing protein n=1 Tax=Miniimonas arenae TaxID=676201 RepID=A0A5C5B801_9MICO|nr:hypothetical protein [Miniimonas arenae]TNU73030.1 hypothetical protein FH969_13620 [Miniimonas arenae]
MSVNVTIRDVPNDVRDVLAARAARSGRSLQEYLKLQLVDLAYRPLAVEVIADLRRHAASLPPLDPQALIDDIAADRQ